MPTSRPGRSAAGKETRYLLARRLFWPRKWPGRFREQEKLLTLNGIRALGRPVRSLLIISAMLSLQYKCGRLSYP